MQRIQHEIEYHKQYFENIGKKFNVKVPSDWGKITTPQIHENGGYSILAQYGNSLSKALRSIFPETEWKTEWFQKAHRINWKEKSHQRAFFESLTKKLGFTQQSDWGKLDARTVEKNGGSSILKYYGHSVFKALKFLYPDREWKMEWFSRFPPRFWHDKKNQREFLDKLSKDLNIEKDSDWKGVTATIVIENGGSSLINMHGGSLYKTLQSVYPEKNWDPDWFINPRARGFWREPENQRSLMDTLAVKLNIQKPSDWGKVKVSDVVALKGGSLIVHHFEGSLFQALKTIYPEIEWNRDWFGGRKLASGYWKDLRNQRKLCDRIGEKLGIKDPKDWSKITTLKFIEMGGRVILNQHGFSLVDSLIEIYPDKDWRYEWFENSRTFPKGHWESLHNQRQFLDEIAKTFGIKNPQDWGNITYKQIMKLGGSSLLNQYSSSLLLALKTVYPDTEWKIEWFHSGTRYTTGHWQDRLNQRNFFEEFAKKHDIVKPTDWLTVTSKQIKDFGGISLLSNYFNNSIQNALKIVFPEIEWDKVFKHSLSTHHRGFWKDPKNHRIYLDELGKRLGVRNPKDWGRITYKTILHYGGGGLFSNHNTGSMFNLLKNTYPDIQWKREWFPNIPKYDSDHFNSMENQRRFLDSIAIEYSINKPVDWKRVTIALIKRKGGMGLLSKYNSSLAEAIKTIYGENMGFIYGYERKINQNFLAFNRSTEQEVVFKKASKYLCSIYWIVTVSDLLSDKSTLKVELDVFVKDFNLAFEYHGVHHFRETFSSSIQDQRSRDENRRIQCKKIGITLIEVPYWWDNEEESLLASILQERPDLADIVVTEMKKDVNRWSHILHDPSHAIPKVPTRKKIDL